MRPPGPVPVTVARSIPRSRASLRTAGAALGRIDGRFPGSTHAGGGAAAGAAAAGGAAAGGGAAPIHSASGGGGVVGQAGPANATRLAPRGGRGAGAPPRPSSTSPVD